MTTVQMIGQILVYAPLIIVGAYMFYGILSEFVRDSRYTEPYNKMDSDHQ